MLYWPQFFVVDKTWANTKCRS